MARRRKTLELALWMNGASVGAWRVTAQGEHELHYDKAWIDSPLGRPISLSMPLRPAEAPYKGDVVRNFFENLLPDNREIRTRIAQHFRTRTDAFSLLQEVGRDCVGALQLLPPGTHPDPANPPRAVPLSEAEVAKHLAELPKGGSFGLEDAGFFRLSLAGAQEKTALLWHEGQWCRPEGSTPTTHILKLPMGTVPGGIDLSTSVENEFVCMQVLRAFGMPTARVAVLRFHGQQVLAIERFDRRFSAVLGWLRLPQEDLAQVFGVDPVRKYEDHGGPGIQAILNQLIGSSNAEADRLDFMRTQVLFWMLAAIDGHAKNFSVHLEPRGAFRLTPRYDVISAYPVMGTTAGRLSPFKVRMAMAVWRTNRHYLWTQIRRAHFEHTARACKIEGFGAVIDELIGDTPRVLAEVGPRVIGLPARVSEPILEGVQRAAERLAMG